MHPVGEPAASALASLSPSQISFLKSLPKAELHAHLNGSIPIECLRELARDFDLAGEVDEDTRAAVRRGLSLFEREQFRLDTIQDFFGLFPAIYAFTATPQSIKKATRAVLQWFLHSEGDCSYLELRTTPRQTPTMSREQYLEAVLDEVELYSGRAGLLVSLDRRMTPHEANQTLDIAVRLRARGRHVVGIDLCGDPLKGDIQAFVPMLERARSHGLGVTVHIAETASNSSAETMNLLSCQPSRLGHATFLDQTAKDFVEANKIPIEICLTSNILCKTVKSLDDHHILHWLRKDHPVVICTDDALPFRTSLLGEYALLMAMPPIGLGLSERELASIGASSMSARFGVCAETG